MCAFPVQFSIKNTHFRNKFFSAKSLRIKTLQSIAVLAFSFGLYAGKTAYHADLMQCHMNIFMGRSVQSRTRFDSMYIKAAYIPHIMNT